MAVYVYLIQSGRFLKIGVSLDPKRRMADLLVPEEPRLLATIECTSRAAAMALESELHARFAAHHQRGEWFRDHDDIRAEFSQRWDVVRGTVTVRMEGLDRDAFQKEIDAWSPELRDRALRALWGGERCVHELVVRRWWLPLDAAGAEVGVPRTTIDVRRAG